MGQNSIASYRDAAGGTVLSTGGAVAQFDTTVREDTGLSRSGGVVQVAEPSVVWARASSGFGLDTGATGFRRLALGLEHKPAGGSFSALAAGHGYGMLPDEDGIRDFGAYLGALVECGAGDELQLRQALQGPSSPGDTLETPDSTSLELITIPASFPVFLAELSSAFGGLGSTWTTVTGSLAATRTDPGFSFDAGLGELTAQNTGRYVIVGNFVFELGSPDPGDTEDMIVQVRVMKNGGAVADSMIRGYMPDHFPTATESQTSLALELPFDAVAGDVITIQARAVFGATTATARLKAGESGFGVFHDSSAAGYFRSEFSPSQDANVSATLEWDQELEDGPGFSHSEVLNPESVELTAGDFWLGVSVPSDRTGSLDTDWLAHRGSWFAGPLMAAAEVNGRGIGYHLNRGWNDGGRKVDHGSLVAGIFLEVIAGGTTVHHQAPKLSTPAVACDWFHQSASNAVGPLFWGIKVSDWPASTKGQLEASALELQAGGVDAKSTGPLDAPPALQVAAQALGATPKAPMGANSLEIAAQPASAHARAALPAKTLEVGAQELVASTKSPTEAQALELQARQVDARGVASLGSPALELQAHGLSASNPSSGKVLQAAALELAAHGLEARQEVLAQLEPAELVLQAHPLRVKSARRVLDLAKPTSEVLALSPIAPAALIDLAEPVPTLLELSR